MKKCYIFGSMEVNCPLPDFSDDDLIIAADAGLKNLQKYNIAPNFIVGDFDSLEYVPEGTNVIKHPVQKDETDTILAVEVGFREGCTDFFVYGCLGGRLDQTVASIQTAAYIAENGGNAVLLDGRTRLTVIKNGKITFSEENTGVISVFAVSEKARGVTLKNLFYETEKAELTPDYPLGVSNEFIGKKAEITVSDGKICVIWNNENADYHIEK